MGAAVPGRWHFWHERCKIGSTSFVNVGLSLLAKTTLGNPLPNTKTADSMIRILHRAAIQSSVARSRRFWV